MFVITETYEDFNGVSLTEDFAFNLTEAELLKLEMGTVGTMTEFINKISKTKNGPELIKLFETIVLMAYGEKSPDGKRFVKNQDLRDAFAQTNAYSQIFMRLASDADKAADFIIGIMPEKARKELPANFREQAKAQAMGNA